MPLVVREGQVLIVVGGALVSARQLRTDFAKRAAGARLWIWMEGELRRCLYSCPMFRQWLVMVQTSNL